MKRLGLLFIVLTLIVGLLLPTPAVEASTLYEYYNTGDDSAGDFYGLYWSAQTFTPQESHKITSIELKLSRAGSPGNVTVGIRATNATTGHPTGDDLCSGTIDGNTLTTDTGGEWREITLGAGHNLSTSTKYAIVARAPSGDMFNSVSWRQDISDPTYVGGNAEISADSGDIWFSYAYQDFMFEEWGLYSSPLITTNNATYVKRTTARLNSYLVDDGGEPCDVRFQYSTVSGGGGDRVANYTNYTEVDPGIRINLTGTTHIDLHAYRNEDAWLVQDYGAGYFTNFLHQVDVNTSTGSADYARGVFWMLSEDTVNDLKYMNTNSKTAVALSIMRHTADYRIYLREDYGGNSYTDYYVVNTGTWYYCTPEKTDTALTCKIYDDSNRTNLVDTLNLTLHADHNFRYIFAANTYNVGSAENVRVQIENLTFAGGNWTNTPWVNDTYTTGDAPYVDIASLALNTTYYFRVQARNTMGTVSGSELNFTTYSAIFEPTNFTAYPDSTTISLTWTKGISASNTMIRQQVGAYPATNISGKQVYAGTMATATDSGLTSGTTYYYRAWSFDGGGYSDNYTDFLMTTSAYSPAANDTPAAPTTPSNWWGTPNYENLQNIAGYELINEIAELYEIPPNTFWMSLILIMIMSIGLFIYSVQHNITVALGLMAVMIVMASIARLLPLWLIAAIGIPVAGIMLVKRRI